MKKPNILVVYADQMRYDCMGPSGNPDVKTPHLDRLAQEGTTFDNAFVSYPLCTPFRGSFLTGKYAHSNGLYSNHFAIEPERQPSIGPILRESGYHNGYIGKWHLFGGPKPGFVPPGPDRMGFDHFVGYNRGHQYMDAVYFRDTEQPYRCKRYEPDVQTEHTIDFMQSVLEKPGDNPFFAYVCFGPPHFPMDMPDYLKKMYDPNSLSLPPGVPDADAQRAFVRERIDYDFDGDANVLEKSKAAGGSKKPGEPETEAEIRQFMAEYYAMISNVDHNVGILLNWLEGRGVLDDTIVIFLSDHGDMLGQHGHFCGWKRSCFRSSMQVPFFVRYPKRFGAGKRAASLVDISIDSMPTLLEICGLPIPDGVQGKSLVPVLESDTPVREAVMYELMKQSQGGREQQHAKPERGIRTLEWLYVRKKDKPVYLFDQVNDPLEQHNLLDNPAYAHVQKELDARVREHMNATGDDYDLEMPWPPRDFVGHAEADRILKSEIHAQAITVP
ncbi:sulfatase family protein [Granulosicoccus sp. 3-233]|uniref:sulfatase family protein n=1 Tax=Granulosicoccus sp. 3-233 TaxID=3417969 RepID=UPI003D351ADE